MLLGIICENENYSDGIQKVLEQLHSKYVPFTTVGGDKVFGEQGFVADQLSIERGVNCLLHVSNGFTAEERLDGIHMEVADFHGQMKFLQVRLLIFILWGRSIAGL